MTASAACNRTSQPDAAQVFDTALTHALSELESSQSRGRFPTLITCLSGGADSTALALLANQFCNRSGLRHCVAIVDHGLRRDSAAEARRVADRMTRLGMSAHILTVTAQPPQAGVQQWARQQRYALLTRLARANNGMLLVAHHADDQAETVAMRLSRGSGIAGLAGMRAVSWRDGVPLVRPLLECQRETLELVCAQHELPFENDPSNVDARFERVQVRRMLANPHAGNLTIQLQRLARAARVIDDRLLDALMQSRYAVQLCPDGSAFLPAPMLDLAKPVCVRALTRVIRLVGGGEHPPVQRAVERLLARLQAGQGGTLGGCRFLREDGRNGEARWLLAAETGRRSATVSLRAGDMEIHAGRWLVRSPVEAAIRPFSACLHEMKGAWRENAQWKCLSSAVRASMPVLQTLDGDWLYPQVTRSMKELRSCTGPAAIFLPFISEKNRFCAEC